MPINRQWVVQHVLTKHHYRAPTYGTADIEPVQDNAMCSTMLVEELRVALKVAYIYPKNYHAWSHRDQVSLLLTKQQVSTSCYTVCFVLCSSSIYVLTTLPQLYKSLKVIEDLVTMEDYVTRHVSDYCGFHQRQLLLVRYMQLCGFRSAYIRTSVLLPLSSQTSCDKEAVQVQSEKDLEECIGVWKKELELCSKLLTSFTGHETLWLHRRFLIFHWLCDIKPQLIATLNKLVATVPGDINWTKIITEENEETFANQSIADSSVERFERQRQLAAAYKLWVAHVASSSPGWMQGDRAKDVLQELQYVYPGMNNLWRAFSVSTNTSG